MSEAEAVEEAATATLSSTAAGQTQQTQSPQRVNPEQSQQTQQSKQQERQLGLQQQQRQQQADTQTGEMAPLPRVQLARRSLAGGGSVGALSGAPSALRGGARTGALGTSSRRSLAGDGSVDAEILRELEAALVSALPGVAADEVSVLSS